MDLDRTVAHATFIAAGELQADVNEVGPEHVAESDLRRAMRRGLQMRLGPVVVPEGGRSFKLEAWPGRLGKPDLAVVGGEGETDQAYVELKWCREDKVWEALWDLLKLTLAVAEGRAEFAYLCTGAPCAVWDKPAACADLFGTGSWPIDELFTRHGREWGWLLSGNKTARPVRLPTRIETRAIASAPIHATEGLDWELRAVGLAPVGRDWTGFEDGWPRLQAQSRRR